MPWDPSDAGMKTSKALTPRMRRQWSHIANSMLERGKSDAQAIRGANSVIAKEFSKLSPATKAKRKKAKHIPFA